MSKFTLFNNEDDYISKKADLNFSKMSLNLIFPKLRLFKIGSVKYFFKLIRKLRVTKSTVLDICRYLRRLKIKARLGFVNRVRFKLKNRYKPKTRYKHRLISTSLYLM